MRKSVSLAVLAAAAIACAVPAQAQDMWTNGMGFDMFSAVNLSGAYVGAGIAAGTGTLATGEWSGANPWLPAVGVFGGYNMFTGNILLGGELDISHGFATHDLGNSWSDRQTRSLPHLISSEPTAGGDRTSGSTYAVIDGGRMDLETHYYDSLQAVALPTASFRIGYQMDQVLFYGRLGGGFAVLNHTRNTDDTRSIYCDATLTRTDHGTATQRTYATECLGPTDGELTSETETHFAPVVVLGLGAEYHFDQMFARAEGRMTHYFLGDEITGGGTDAAGLTTFQLGLGVGVRF